METRSWRTRLLLLTVPVVVLIVGAELVLRAFDPPGVDTPEVLRVHRASADPELVWEYAPGASTAAPVPVRINAQGFRDDPFPEPESGGARRIVVVGDSVASGWGVAMADAWPQVLEARLRERAQAGGGVPPVVLNCAVNGYSTRQELRLLETRGLALAPDVVVLGYVLNDPDDLDGGLGRHFVVRSRLWALVRRGMRSLLERDLPTEYHERVHARNGAAVESSFARLGALSERTGIPIVVLVTPVFGGDGSAAALDDASYRWTAIHARIAGLCEAHGLEFVDARPALARAHVERPEEPLAFDVWHPSRRGHRVIAEVVEGVAAITGQ